MLPDTGNYTLDQIEASASSRSRGGMLINVRVNIDYEQIVPKGRLCSQVISVLAGSSLWVQQRSRHGTISPSQLFKLTVVKKQGFDALKKISITSCIDIFIK